MIVVACPHCAGRFRLARGLVGPGGARVRCPSCERAFDWTPTRRPPPEAGAPSRSTPSEAESVVTLDTDGIGGGARTPEIAAWDPELAGEPAEPPAGEPALTAEWESVVRWTETPGAPVGVEPASAAGSAEAAVGSAAPAGHPEPASAV